MPPNESTILVVDDNEPARYAKMRTLRGAGYKTREAATGAEALRLVADAKPDLVLLDIKLPDISGLDICARVKRNRPDIIVVQTSATFVEKLDRVRGLEGGADAYLTEPIEGDELLANVAALLRLKRAEAALREGEERLRLAFAAANMGSWEWDVVTGRVTWSRNMERLAGLAPGTFGGTVAAFRALVHRDDLPRIEKALAAALDGKGEYDVEFRMLNADGTVRWTASRAAVMRDEAGRPIRMVGVDVDITARKAAEERLMLLAREVDHRAKNMLAVVQAMVRLTRADTVEGLVEALEGRIGALARAHNLLAGARWQGAEIQRLVGEELAPYRVGDGGRIDLSGPAMSLAPTAAQSLAMALHELATNAAKYGALSAPGGRVAITWRHDEAAGLLILRWCETGGPTVRQPAHRGFGMGVIERTIGQHIGGEVRFDWRPEGLVCELRLPAGAPGAGSDGSSTGA
jgi:PAS domain S-box-containing protein